MSLLPKRASVIQAYAPIGHVHDKIEKELATDVSKHKTVNTAVGGEGECEVTGEGADLKRIIDDLCQSKAEEFAQYGYENVTGEQVWQCVSDKYGEEIPALHQLVNDILSLKASRFMNWMTLNAYKGAGLD